MARRRKPAKVLQLAVCKKGQLHNCTNVTWFDAAVDTSHRWLGRRICVGYARVVKGDPVCAMASDVTVQTCGDLGTIRPLVEGQPSTEFPLQTVSVPSNVNSYRQTRRVAA